MTDFKILKFDLFHIIGDPLVDRANRKDVTDCLGVQIYLPLRKEKKKWPLVKLF